MTLALLTALLLASSAFAASLSTLHRREHRQTATLHRDVGTLRFFASHSWLVRSPKTQRIAHRAIRFARAQIAWTRRELAETRAGERARDTVSFGAPSWFVRQALCVHSHEGSWTDRGYFRGGMQFLTSTWQSVGGEGDPADATPREQIYRAYLVWLRDGGSWREWPNTSRMCGLA